MVSGGTLIWLCWLVVPERLPESFKVSSRDVDVKASLLASSSGVFDETGEKSAIICRGHRDWIQRQSFPHLNLDFVGGRKMW